jgi:hypothetical protein
MNKNKTFRLTGLIAVMFVLLACSVFSQTTPPVATSTPFPAETATATIEVPTSTATATSIPATLEPVVVIRLGPGKYEQPIWLEVLSGRYQIASGDILLTGSAIGVYTEALTFPTGMQIEIGEGGLVLMGVSYEAGTLLVVDDAGKIVARTGTEGTASTSNGKILFQDDFSSNDTGWDVGVESDEYGELNSAITDGQYVMTLNGKQNYFFVITSIPDFSAKDFVMSMDVTVLESAVASGNMSLEFSVREADGVNGKHYSFRLFNDGTSSGEVWPTDKYQDIVEFWSREANSAITFNKGVTNTISFEANGTTFTLYVNGQKINEVTDPTINEAGDISFNLSLDRSNEAMTIAFDNLIITTIP